MRVLENSEEKLAFKHTVLLKICAMDSILNTVLAESVVNENELKMLNFVVKRIRSDQTF